MLLALLIQSGIEFFLWHLVITMVGWEHGNVGILPYDKYDVMAK